MTIRLGQLGDCIGNFCKEINMEELLKRNYHREFIIGMLIAELLE